MPEMHLYLGLLVIFFVFLLFLDTVNLFLNGRFDSKRNFM